MTRYYGLYARHREKDKSLYKAVPKSRHQILQNFTKMVQQHPPVFWLRPLNCQECNHKMQLLKVYYDYHRVSLQELYKKAMAPKLIAELSRKYIKKLPKGMTAKFIQNMGDSDLLDMHYFLTEDDEFEEVFYIDLF